MRAARLPEQTLPIINDAERAAAHGASFTDVLPILRRLTLDDFGLLFWSMPHPELPELSSVLPPMADEDIQVAWTGASGEALLKRSTWFPKLLARRRSLKGSRIVDVGCGYGRLMRLMYYYADPRQVIGLDPWPESLAHAAVLPSTFHQVDAVPERYPVEGADIAYAFSVFTHLSERAAHAVLGAVRAMLKPGGLFVVTVRPVTYWAAAAKPREVAEQMAAAHNERGFAFTGHISRQDYGDTSISLDYMKNLPGWRCVGYDHDRLVSDPLQIAVLLEPDTKKRTLPWGIGRLTGR